MANLLLARWQFGITTVYHFLFVPLTIGLVIIVALMETLYVTRKDEKYKQMAKFWGKLFLINFAVGVVTGILQEFQFGMNWASYSRFVGDVFGAPLAVEALLAFFMESTFLGIWIFGWDRVSKGLHLAAIWLVALGTTLSALWILAANSFMQEPVGYAVRNGHAEMTSFGALLTNPQLLFEFPHVWFGAVATGSFMVLGVSAYMLLRKRDVHIFKPSFQIAVTLALISSVLVAVVGHGQAQHLVKEQPMKMAASEALWTNSPDVAPWSLVAVIDRKDHKDTMNIQIPGVLSLLAYNNLHGSVQGMDELQQQYVQKYGPGNYIPPVQPTYWSFRFMVLAGSLMILMAIWGQVMVARNKLEKSRKMLRLFLPAIALPYIANTLGWIMTEIGRQPWAVFGLLKTTDGVSPTVTAGMVGTSVVVFTLVYAIMAVICVFLFVRTVRQGVQPVQLDASHSDTTITPL